MDNKRQLLLTFCKVEVHDLKPKGWHGWLLLFQTGFTAGRLGYYHRI